LKGESSTITNAGSSLLLLSNSSSKIISGSLNFMTAQGGATGVSGMLTSKAGNAT